MIFSRKKKKSRLGIGRDLAGRLKRQKVIKKTTSKIRRGSRKKPAGKFAGIKLPKLNMPDLRPMLPGLKYSAKLAGLMAVTGLLLISGFSLLAEASYFRVKQAVVTGTGQISRLQVLSAAGIGAHSSLIRLKQEKIEKALTALPVVATAEVKRVFPSSVHIHIEEYKPVALGLVEGRFYLLDSNLFGFYRLESAGGINLPVVTGLTVKDVCDPDPEISDLFEEAKLLVLTDLGSPREPLGRIEEIHLDRVWGVSLVYAELKATVRLGRQDISRKLARLNRVVADLKLRDELHRATLIDLSTTKGAIVRLAKDKA